MTDKIEFSYEELLRNANIQSNLINLQSRNREKVKTALTTLAAITCHTDRKDALYTLMGIPDGIRGHTECLPT